MIILLLIIIMIIIIIITIISIVIIQIIIMIIKLIIINSNDLYKFTIYCLVHFNLPNQSILFGLYLSFHVFIHEFLPLRNCILVDSSQHYMYLGIHS